jgi:beta-lactamase class D
MSISKRSSAAMRSGLMITAALLISISFHDAGAQQQDTVSRSSDAESIITATGFSGAVLVHDLNKNTFTAAHPELLNERLIPASTFKILSALIALETGVIETRSSIIDWDGITRDRNEINQSLDLTSAFRLSAVPHFQELVRRIGAERMQHFLDEVGYGNRDISGGIDTFWLTGGLRISLWEQVEFLRRLHQEELPFSSATMTAVKEMMITETGADYLIRAKTGLATLDDQTTGWWVGWVEQDSQVHFFATVLQARAPDQSFIPARIEVTRKVLQMLNLLEGSQL